MEFNVLCTVNFYYQPEIKKNRDANFPFFDSDRGFQGSNRYHFEKHFSPDLCAYLMLTVLLMPQMQPVEGLWRDAPGPQLSPGIREAACVHVGSSSHQWRQLPALRGDHVLPWRRHLALRAVLKHFKYRCQVACVPRGAQCPPVWEPLFWLEEAG